MKLVLFALLSVLSFTSIAQNKREYTNMVWPPEYNWKVVDQTKTDNLKSVVIIPGNEMPKSATIVGTLKAYMGTHLSSLTELANFYKKSIDSSVKFTVISSSDSLPRIWVMFKTETAGDKKFPQAESDLVYAIQGDAALYEYTVAVKQPSLTQDFIDKWIQVFKTVKIGFQ